MISTLCMMVRRTWWLGITHVVKYTIQRMPICCVAKVKYGMDYNLNAKA